jgi:hypothetical protein
VMGQPNQCTMYGYPDLSHWIPPEYMLIRIFKNSV